MNAFLNVMQKSKCSICKRKLHKRSVDFQTIYFKNPYWCEMHDTCFKRLELLRQARELIKKNNPTLNDAQVDEALLNYLQ